MEDHLYRQFYEIENTHWWFTARRAILIAYLRQRIGDHRVKLLDVGCGTGAILADASKYFEAYGMDASPDAIAFCQQRGVTNLYVGTLREYPASGKFDVITLLDVIEHIDDDLDVLHQAYARLNDGGHVLITVPAYQWLWSAHDEVNHHKRRYTRTRLRSLVREAGFQIEDLTYFNTLLFPLAVIRRAYAQLTRSDKAEDFAVPVGPVNIALHTIFRMEQYILPHCVLPFGLSVLCWATKPGT